MNRITLHDWTLEPGDKDKNGQAYADIVEYNEAMDKLARNLDRDNIVYIKGIAYTLENYTDMKANGTRSATLKIFKPF